MTSAPRSAASIACATVVTWIITLEPTSWACRTRSPGSPSANDMTAGRAASVWRNASASNVGGMWFTAKFRFVSSFTTSMSRLMAALVRNSDPILPNAPSFDAAAANSADDAVPPIAARMIGTSMPRTSHRAVLSICAFSFGAWSRLSQAVRANPTYSALSQCVANPYVGLDINRVIMFERNRDRHQRARDRDLARSVERHAGPARPFRYAADDGHGIWRNLHKSCPGAKMGSQPGVGGKTVGAHRID